MAAVTYPALDRATAQTLAPVFELPGSVGVPIRSATAARLRATMLFAVVVAATTVSVTSRPDAVKAAAPPWTTVRVTPGCRDCSMTEPLASAPGRMIVP